MNYVQPYFKTNQSVNACKKLIKESILLWKLVINLKTIFSFYNLKFK